MNNNQTDCLIFLHIPKAAGSTLHQIIDRQYKSELIFTIDPTNAKASKDKLSLLDEVEKSKIKVVKGHMSFGWHKILPHNYTYITMLRDPIERVISLYCYILSYPQHYLYDLLIEKNMSLRDFVQSGISAEIENCQTRLLSGMEELIQKPFVNSGKCPVEWLEIAKKNLAEDFMIFGITERFDESLILFQQSLGWNIPLYIKENVNKNRISISEISEDDLRLITTANQLDIELYRYGIELFNQKINHKTNHGFQKEVNWFKKLNKFYSLYVNTRKYIYRIKNKSSFLIKTSIDFTTSKSPD